MQGLHSVACTKDLYSCMATKSARPYLPSPNYPGDQYEGLRRVRFSGRWGWPPSHPCKCNHRWHANLVSTCAGRRLVVSINLRRSGWCSPNFFEHCILAREGGDQVFVEHLIRFSFIIEVKTDWISEGVWVKSVFSLLINWARELREIFDFLVLVLEGIWVSFVFDRLKWLNLLNCCGFW